MLANAVNERYKNSENIRKQMKMLYFYLYKIKVQKIWQYKDWRKDNWGHIDNDPLLWPRHANGIKRHPRVPLSLGRGRVELRRSEPLFDFSDANTYLLLSYIQRSESSFWNSKCLSWLACIGAKSRKNKDY